MEARTINSMESIWCNNMLVYLSLDIICSSRLTVYHKHPSQKTVCILELVIRRQISVHIFAPNGGYCWIPVSKAAFGHSDASIFILKGYHDYFRTLTPSPPPDPQRWSICLQRRNRRLYDRGSHSFVGSKSTFPCQRIVYVVIKRLHFRIFSDSVFSN